MRQGGCTPVAHFSVQSWAHTELTPQQTRESCAGTAPQGKGQLGGGCHSSGLSELTPPFQLCTCIQLSETRHRASFKLKGSIAYPWAFTANDFCWGCNLLRDSSKPRSARPREASHHQVLWQLRPSLETQSHAEATREGSERLAPGPSRCSEQCSRPAGSCAREAGRGAGAQHRR